MIDPIIPFRIRIRETDQISDGQKRLAASIIFAHLQPGQREILSGRRWVWADWSISQLYVSKMESY
jgi:hypothetical protein